MEVPREQAAEVVRAFVRRRAGGQYAFGLDPDAPFEIFLSEAERHPVFRIVPIA